MANETLTRLAQPQGRLHRGNCVSGLLNIRFLIVFLCAAGFAAAFFVQRGRIDGYYRDERWMVISEHAEQAEPGVTLILGDSLVERQRIVDMCGPALNAGVIGSTTADMLPHVAPVILAAKPARIVLGIGVNDRRADVPLADFAARYDLILKDIGAIPSLVVGVYGGGPYDAEVRRQAQARGLKYIPYPVGPEMTIDGLHLSAAGAQVWRTAVRAALCG